MTDQEFRAWFKKYREKNFTEVAEYERRPQIDQTAYLNALRRRAEDENFGILKRIAMWVIIIVAFVLFLTLIEVLFGLDLSQGIR